MDAWWLLLVESFIVICGMTATILACTRHPLRPEQRNAGVIFSLMMVALWLVHGISLDLSGAQAGGHIALTLLLAAAQWLFVRELTRPSNTIDSAYYRDLLLGITNGTGRVIFAKNRAGEYVVANTDLEALIGIHGGTLLGKTDFDIFPKDFADKFRRDDEEIFVHGRTIERIELVPRDGDMRTFQMLKFPVRNARDEVIAVGVIATDITEAEVIRKQLQDTNQFLDCVLENIPAAVFVKRASDLKFVRVNKSAEEFFGFSRDQLLGRGDTDFFAPEEAAFFNEKDREVLYGLKVLDIPEETITTPHLGKRYLRTKKIALHNEFGTPEYLLGIAEDITRRVENHNQLLTLTHKLEARVTERTTELQHANDALRREVRDHIEHKEKLEHSTAALERANAELFQFVFAASNDVQGSLDAIRGLACTICERNIGQLDADGQQSLIELQHRTSRVQRLLEDLSQYATLSAARYEFEEVDLGESVAAAIAAASDSARFRVRVESPLPHVQAPRALLTECLARVIEQTCKHSAPEQGEVQVAARQLPGFIEVTVSVDGTGLSRALRADSEQISTTPGDASLTTSFDLACARKIVERVGGFIRVDPRGETGTAVHICWPDPAPQQKPIESSAETCGCETAAAIPSP